ncbi:hypothetical protein [uncultured Paracoccus sp.]|uniref:hypothetical protein n=1 Tax=uncultured Paracoccus sp. TaxID=189685 RepID=UPI0026097E6B|nr:hypothetical protein [uncultured Paracoccus sp.]
MTRLFFLLLSLIMTTLAGIGVIAVLVMGFETATAIIAAAAIGAVIAVPVAWLVARKLENLD